MKKKHLLIIFPDEWLSHCPTVLNLVKCLSDVFDIRVIAIDDGCYKNNELNDDRFKFIKINPLLARYFLRRIIVLYRLIRAILLFMAVLNYRKTAPVDCVLGVDSAGLWVAQNIFKRSHFLSLEIKKDLFFKLCARNQIASIAIQTKARCDFLFPQSVTNMFIIPNAPIVDKSATPGYADRSYNGNMILLGNLTASHGLFQCIETLRHNNGKELSLTLKGIVYHKKDRQELLRLYRPLFARRRLILDESYTAQEELVNYLSGFSIGFCLYDFSLISKGDFNYISCPSGKLFNYLAAGLPVIGTDIIGLQPVQEFQAGILLKDLSVKSIQSAIDQIADNFVKYHRNALKASESFDFAEAVKPYRKFLTG
jgi:glycosyltransferase involved in cell wall biosynthesis